VNEWNQGKEKNDGGEQRQSEIKGHPVGLFEKLIVPYFVNENDERAV
jgi:hypothetical protein